MKLGLPEDLPRPAVAVVVADATPLELPLRPANEAADALSSFALFSMLPHGADSLRLRGARAADALSLSPCY